MDHKSKRNDRIKEGMEKAALQGAAAETVQRFGSAAKEHFVAYSGIDNEAEKTLTKGLKSISKAKINHEYQSQNIKQQAGFSAEVKSVARRNAKNIIEKKASRYTRTDDIGRVNDPLLDLVEINERGVISNSGSQMKFVGKTPEELLNKLIGSKYQKYLDADVILDVADDDYAALIGINGEQGIIDAKIEKLRKQLERASQDGKKEVAESKRAQIEKCEKIKKNLRKSGLTREEAIEARLNPKLSTAKDVIQIAHNAGKEQIKYGAAISGSVSIIKNMVACIQGEKTPIEAAESVVRDTGTGAAVSYVTALSGTVIKGSMQNAESGYVRSLAKTNFAASLVTTTIDVGKTLHKFITGKIDGTECIEELGEKGVGQISAGMFASAGIAVIPQTAPAILSVMGGVAGATFGYAAGVACYQELSSALEEAKLASQERIQVEKACNEAIEMIRKYRAEMETLVSQYLADHIQTFNESFLEMDRAILSNDINGFIKGNVDIQRMLGKEIRFENQQEFDDLMTSDKPLKL